MDNLVSKKISSKKSLAGLMLFIITANFIIGGILLPIKTAQATYPTIDMSKIVQDAGEYVKDAAKWVWTKAQAAYHAAGTWVSAGIDLWDKQNKTVKAIEKFAWDRLRRRLLNMMVNDIIAWIQGGGKPRFVSDWRNFGKTAADKAAGDLIKEYGAGFLCSGFSLQLRIALSSPPKFDESATCTLSMAIDNVNNFMNDFSQGGWKGWITISESQNNYMGAYITALNKKYGVMAEAAGAQKDEAMASAGFLGDKVCHVIRATEDYNKGIINRQAGSWTEDEIPEGYACEEGSWEIRTPGRIVGDSLQQAVGVDFSMLISAKEFSEYAGAIIDAAINRVIREGVAKLTATDEGTSSGYGITGSPTVPGINAPAAADTNNISTYADASQNSDIAASLTNQIKLLKENLTNALQEYQTNMGILTAARNAQASALEKIRQIAETVNCGLPSAVSIASDAIISQSDNCALNVCPCAKTEIHKKSLTVANGGSATLIETIVYNYDSNNSGLGFGGGACDHLNKTDKTAVLSDIVYAASPLIGQTEKDMTATQEKISLTDTAINLLNQYYKIAIDYLALYDQQSQKAELTTEEKAQLTAMETATIETQKRAIIAVQTAVDSKLENLSLLEQDTMKYSQQLAGVRGDIMTLRGAIADCEYAASGTLYYNQCAANALNNTIEAARQTCLNTALF